MKYVIIIIAVGQDCVTILEIRLKMTKESNTRENIDHATGKAEEGERPVDVRPAERAGHGRPTIGVSIGAARESEETRPRTDACRMAA